MNRKYVAQISALLMSAAVTSASTCSQAAIIKAQDMNEIIQYGEYSYELWNRDGAGDVSFIPDESGNFTFSAIGNIDSYFLFYKDIDNTRQWNSYSKFHLKGDFDYKIVDQDLFYGASGWIEDKSGHVEFTIIEGWDNWRPPGSVECLESVEIEGVLYDIYVTMPSTMGGIMAPVVKVPRFFWSVRRENINTEASETASVSIDLLKHIEVWCRHGLDKNAVLYRAGLYADAYSCKDGNINFSNYEITIEDKEPEEPTVTEPSVTEPVVTEPEVTEPVVTDVSEPEITEPAVTEITEPVLIVPGTIESTEPEPKEPEPTETSEPAVTEIKPEEPGDIDPKGPDAPETEEFDSGDTDGNGAVNAADFVVMRKHLLNSDETRKESKKAFDMNKDGKINVVDLILLRSIIGGK